MHATTNVLAKLSAAETTLIAAIDATTANLEQIATGRIDAALARMEEATRRVHGRLGAAIGTLTHTTGEAVDCMEALADDILAQLTLNIASDVQPLALSGPADPARWPAGSMIDLALPVVVDPTPEQTDGAQDARESSHVTQTAEAGSSTEREIASYKHAQHVAGEIATFAANPARPAKRMSRAKHGSRMA